MYDETNQIGLPGSDQLWKQQLNESGLQMNIAGWITAGAAVVGGISSWLGGNAQADAAQDAADDRARAAAEMAAWQWDETKRRESYQQYELDIARMNEKQLRDLTDAIALDKYNRALYIRDYDYKSRVEAYNASEEQYGRQLDYNAMSAQLAREEQHNWMLDTRQELQFQYEDIAMEFGKARDHFDITREDITHRHIDARGEFALKGLEGWLKGLDAKAKVRVLGQAGRTSAKNLQAVAAATGQNQAILNDLATKSDHAFNIKQRENFNTYTYARREAELGERKTAAAWDSALRANELALLKIDHERYGADMAADNRRMPAPPKYNELPPIPAPYATPETIFPEIFHSTKPPGPAGAPNVSAGAGWIGFGNFMSSVASAVSNIDFGSPGGGSGNTTSGGGGNWNPNEGYNPGGGWGPVQTPPSI